MRVEDQRKLAASAELLQERIQNRHIADGIARCAPDRTATNHPTGLNVGELHECFDVDSVEEYVGFNKWPKDEELPGWVSVFIEILDDLTEPDLSYSVPDAFDAQYPFEDILYQIVDSSSRRLVGSMETEHMSEEALLDFKEHLLDRTVDVSAKALHLDFLKYVSEHDSRAVEQDCLSPNSTYWYDRYVSDFFDGRVTDFFKQFPMLGRLITVVTSHWEAAVSRFVSRLRNDYSAICSTFGLVDPGKVIRIDPGEDPHDEGQTVLVVEFETGTEIVYKPREIEPEKQLYAFESWLSEQLDKFPTLRIPEIITRSEYGWVEKVEGVEFTSVERVENYYRRAGALMCILYLLNVSDCHFENIVACDASPVLVDAETILQTHPSIGKVSQLKPNTQVQQHVVRSSILGTMLLPFRMNGRSNNHSGFGAVKECKARMRTVSWEHINTDAMEIDHPVKTIAPESNVPVYAGDPIPPSEFVEEILDGFGMAYDELSNNRVAVWNQIKERFEGLQVRKIVQETVVYRALLETLTNPEYLRDGVKHDYKIQKTLSERWATSPLVTETSWIEAERTAIARRDIPKFTMPTDGCQLYLDEEEVPTVAYGRTGMKRVEERIRGMSERDKSFQQGLIRACLTNTNGTGDYHGEGR